MKTHTFKLSRYLHYDNYHLFIAYFLTLHSDMILIFTSCYKSFKARTITKSSTGKRRLFADARRAGIFASAVLWWGKDLL